MRAEQHSGVQMKCMARQAVKSRGSGSAGVRHRLHQPATMSLVQSGARCGRYRHALATLHALAHSTPAPVQPR